MNSAISQRTQVKNTWKNMYTDGYLIDWGPMNMESGVIQTLCVKYIFLSTHEERSDKQINSANRTSREICAIKNWLTVVKPFSEICVVNWYIMISTLLSSHTRCLLSMSNLKASERQNNASIYCSVPMCKTICVAPFIKSESKYDKWKPEEPSDRTVSGVDLPLDY